VYVILIRVVESGDGQTRRYTAAPSAASGELCYLVLGPTSFLGPTNLNWSVLFRAHQLEVELFKFRNSCG